MHVVIKPIEDHEKYSINGHIVQKHWMYGWLAAKELSDMELKAFSNYKKVVIENDRFKKHPKSTYKS